MCYRKDGYLPEVFDHLVSVITELNQNENFRKEGTNIYERYIYQLFRSLKDNEVNKKVFFFQDTNVPKLSDLAVKSSRTQLFEKQNRVI